MNTAMEIFCREPAGWRAPGFYKEGIVNNNRKAELFDAMLKWLDRTLEPSDFRNVAEEELGIWHSEMKELGYYRDEPGENDDDSDECFPGCPCRCCECEHAAECALDREIPCSPDCVNITHDGKVRIWECMHGQCGAADIVANAVLEKEPHGVVVWSDGRGKFPESYTEGDGKIFAGLFGKAVAYPFRLDVGTYYSRR